MTRFCEGRSRVAPEVVAALRSPAGVPVAGASLDHLSVEERAMVEFIREADRYRAGLPHALTPEQADTVEETRESARLLVADFIAAGPGADAAEVVAAWAEEHGYSMDWRDRINTAALRGAVDAR